MEREWGTQPVYYTARVLHSPCSELHVRGVIRRGGYRSRQDTHKLIANAYALLTDRRRQELLEGPLMPVHRDPESGVVLYTWTTGETIKRLTAVAEELLRSEGIDPPWVPFSEAELAEAESLSTRGSVRGAPRASSLGATATTTTPGQTWADQRERAGIPGVIE
jgi:hypothetical protein